MKRYLTLLITLLTCTLAHSSQQQWHTHFAYNSVHVIALDQEQVFAVANGKLFSVHQNTEQITIYTNLSGLHGTDIAQIAQDTARSQTLIVYSDGKIDIRLQNGHMRYIPDLYNKQLTTAKTCHNITIHQNMAYLSMDFGIITLDLEQYEIVDTYYIGAQAKEVQVMDILIHGDSIYAKDAQNAVYAAHLQDNIVDYRFWTKYTQHPAPFDLQKGQVCVSPNGDIWRVAGTKGVEREFVTHEKTYYLPFGPEVNIPYHMACNDDQLIVVPGGRWVNQNKAPGHIMIYDIPNQRWINITNTRLNAITGKQAMDLTAIAIDPNQPNHYFVTSYGTGLYELQDSTLLHHYTPSNSILRSAAPDYPDRYTRVESPVFDAEGRLWVTVAGGIDTTLVAFMPDGSQRGLNLHLDPNTRFTPNTPGPMIIDATNPQRKWLISCRSQAAVILLDDAGTPFDPADDQCVSRTDFRDQDGISIIPEFFFAITQAQNGDIWIGSSEGPIIIPAGTDPLRTNQCQRLRIKMPDESNLLEEERVNAFAWDQRGQLWIGTHTAGIYVLNTQLGEVVARYTSDNSAMPSNTVISLAYNHKHDQMFIGTGSGLVSIKLGAPISAGTQLDNNDDSYANMGNMYQWRAHNAFTHVDQIEVVSDKVYGLSSHSLYTLTKKTGEIIGYSQLDGLSSSNISRMAYNHTLKNLILTYSNGHIDILDQQDRVRNIADLYLKSMTADKEAHDIAIHSNKAYLAMSFGILVINMQKAEIEDTYYIGHEGNEVNVRHICTIGDTIYALTHDSLYCATIGNNLADYANWTTLPTPTFRQAQGLRQYKGNLYAILGSQLYVRKNGTWNQLGSRQLSQLCFSAGELYLIPYYAGGVGVVRNTAWVEWILPDMLCYSIAKYGNYYWLGTEDGIVLYNIDSDTQSTYYIEGPASNFAYKLRFFDDRLYMVPGGRWANSEQRKGDIMIYENDQWRNIKYAHLRTMLNGHKPLDLMNVAQDPLDHKHYFVSSYGTGLYELYNDSVIQLYLPDNSPLVSAAPAAPTTYTRTDAVTYDDQGNLWVLNAGGGDIKNVHVIDPNGIWHSYNLTTARGQKIDMHTPGDILIDARNPHHKWIPLLRYNTGLILLDDNGTPTRPSDDIVTYRTEWMDQNNNQLLPNTIHTVAQDHHHALWIGTDDGIIVIPNSVDFRTSNKCIRVIIPRNDGTMLGDYLLDNEQVNDIKIDGANRLWVATANSGVYLLQPTEDYVESPTYYVETVAHFTTDNSILPSNNVLSIAIQESTGEVFFGTGGGLVSYMSDATPGQDDFQSIYSFPNPVRPDYQGYVTIRGLVENSQVRILDAGGTLIRTIPSMGGTATWDLLNAHGQRATSGVYTAICNTDDGKQHGSTKILVIH